MRAIAGSSLPALLLRTSKAPAHFREVSAIKKLGEQSRAARAVKTFVEIAPLGGLVVRDDVYGLLGIDALDQSLECTFDFRTMRFSIRPEQ